MLIDTIQALTDHKLWLAPLAGYTDQAFRLVCKSLEADVLVSEMVSADGLMRGQKRTLDYLAFCEEERPFGIQLFGSNPEVMARAARRAGDFQPDFLNINMGCPVKKVIKRKAGGALLTDLPLATSIISQVRQAIPANLPLTVKLRSGFDHSHLNYREFGMAMEHAGAHILILHPRTVSQGFHGVSNWEHIRLLKQAVSIPVIGNGDIKHVSDALRMFSDTGCDGIMLGRGVLGNPWLFGQIKAALVSGNSDASISHQKRFETILSHIETALKHKPEHLVQKELKSQLCFYIKGLPHSAVVRNQINQADSVRAIREIIISAFAE